MIIDCDDSVRFQFKDLFDGYVDLDLSQKPQKGWTITPRKNPLRVSIVKSVLLIPLYIFIIFHFCFSYICYPNLVTIVTTHD